MKSVVQSYVALLAWYAIYNETFKRKCLSSCC